MANLSKIQGLLGEETCKELDALAPEQLEARCVQAHKAIKQAKEELDASREYQEAKENVKALSAGYRDLRKRQQAISDYALYLLEEKGK